MKERTYDIDDELLVKYLLDEANLDERLEVKRWIDRDLANQKYFEDFQTIWQRSKDLEHSSTIDEDASWNKFKNRITAPQQKARVVGMFSLLKVAAIVILIAGAAFAGYLILNNSKVQTLAVHSGNEIMIDTLPDHSIITLNKNSSISYPENFKGDTRTISLEGEAFFNITPNKKKPFIIHVNDVTVKVVGTSFNIKTINGNTEVVVETGIVEVMHDKASIQVMPSEKIMVNKDQSSLMKENQTEKLYNYYRSKEFVCDNTPLQKLVEILNEAYEVHIVIDRKELQNQPITTTFSNESLDNILSIIEKTFNISITRSGDQIKLY